MAFTGDLEHLHIVDIIQLLNTTRKSGILTVKGERGSSQIIFSNGSIVGASHLDNKIRIGSVLVKSKYITGDDLREALDFQKKAGKNRKPLIATLIDLGKLEQAKASKALRKLIEITLVELVGWTKGKFILDTDILHVSPECDYPIDKMQQEIGLDAQMILMEALRIFDEKERERKSGKKLLSEEDFFIDVVSTEPVKSEPEIIQHLTADDLGLGQVEHLERKIPEYLSIEEMFDPLEIHRQKIRETLADYPEKDREALASFLGRSATRTDIRERPASKDGGANAVVLFSDDGLIKHAAMTICKAQDVLVFATDREQELQEILGQCVKMNIPPVLFFDIPDKKGALSGKEIIGLRDNVRRSYPQISVVQLTTEFDYDFSLSCLHDGVRAVFPRPSKETRKDTFIRDLIKFLETFQIYARKLFLEREKPIHNQTNFKSGIADMRKLKEPSEVFISLLRKFSELCERSVLFTVRPEELEGEKAIGVFADRNAGPTPAMKLKIPLKDLSLVADVIKKGALYCGEKGDKVFEENLYHVVGAPLATARVLVPVMSRGKTVALFYGDFGGNEARPVDSDLLEMLAQSAGLILENTVLRNQLRKQIQG